MVFDIEVFSESKVRLGHDKFTESDSEKLCFSVAAILPLVVTKQFVHIKSAKLIYSPKEFSLFLLVLPKPFRCAGL